MPQYMSCKMKSEYFYEFLIMHNYEIIEVLIKFLLTKTSEKMTLATIIIVWHFIKIKFKLWLSSCSFLSD